MMKSYQNREDWIKARSEGIGGSEASSIVGMNPWKSRDQLLLEKIKGEVKEVEDNKPMQFGRNMEPVLVDVFSKLVSHKSVEHNKTYDVYSHDEHTFVRYTPDAVYETLQGDKGVLEIKTTTISPRNHLSQWVGQLPDHYMIQVLHGFLANPQWHTISWLAFLIRKDETGVFNEIRQGHYVREDVVKPLSDLLEAEKKFWREVEDGREKNN